MKLIKVNVLDFMMYSSSPCRCLLRSAVPVAGEEPRPKDSPWLWHSCVFKCRGGARDTLIPSDKHLLCEQMRRADGVLLGWAELGWESEGKVAHNAKWQERLALLNRSGLSACQRGEVNREMSLKVLNVSKFRASSSRLVQTYRASHRLRDMRLSVRRLYAD